MRIEIKDDTDLAKIQKSGQCFRVKRFEDGTYRFITGKNVLYIRSLGNGYFDITCSRRKWEQVWAPYFDLARNYGELINRIPPTDSFLRKAAEEGKGIRILRQEPWEMLITFIISQQKTIPAISAAVEELCRRYGKPICNEREILYTFPGPGELRRATKEELSACRLGYRVSYVTDAVLRGDISRLSDLSDEDLLAALLEIRGVGIKVANCVALFAFGRSSLAPIDTWIRKLIDGVYGGRDPFPDYGNAAGIMQQYAFFYAQNHKQEVNSLLEIH